MTKHYQKRSAPSAERNKLPIGVQLNTLLPENAHVLEIASGTGQHGAYFTEIRPDIVWQYSDIDKNAHESQLAYALDKPTQLLAPLQLDVSQENWWQNIAPITNIYCANMIHIAPWEAAMGLAKGAGALLGSGDKLFLYGPFLMGHESARSNLEFAQNLKCRNSKWGVRELADVEDLMADNGLRRENTIHMPRDNFLLVFVKM